MDHPIDRNKSEKLYIQLYDILRNKIEKSEWQVGSQIPTEEELCKTYEVSKATVRLSILELVRQGYLTRHQGKGTFVCKRIIPEGLMMSTSFREHMLEAGVNLCYHPGKGLSKVKFKLFAENGYNFPECASALQKCIRRGLEEEAMFWAAELETKFHEYLWKRLQIISVEDIGIADPQAVLYVAEMRRIYAELRKEYDKKDGKANRSFRMALGNAILAMCRAKKSRIGDEFQIVIYGRRDAGWKLEIPDYALDMHTQRGRQMGRGG